MQNSDFGARLQALRRAGGWSQSDIARRSGIPQGHISELEAGVRGLERLLASTLLRLAAALGVSVSTLTTLPVLQREG